jgi:protein TonB
VTAIKTSAPEGCELLEREASRIIQLLPKFMPGEQKGEPVSVSYAQPIMFRL